MNGTLASGITAYFPREHRDFDPYEVEHDPRPICATDQNPVVCSACGAVYHQDRWTWSNKPEESCETTCPACLRIQDRVPGGILTVRGDCLKEHKHEIMRLIRHTIQKIGKQHPLKRVMDVEDDETEAVFTFTDSQLPREIGDVLHQNYDGVLDFQYSNEDSMLRVVWQR